MRGWLVGGALCCLTACTSAPPLNTVASVDLPRYQGVWHEIGRLPNRFQSFCAADVRATYRLAGDTVQVLNQCQDAQGEVRQAEGQAYAQPGSGNARLRVSFFWPFYGDYQIMQLDPDYQWVLVGAPSRAYLWILARQPRLASDTREALLAEAVRQGFDVSSWQWTVAP